MILSLSLEFGTLYEYPQILGPKLLSEYHRSTKVKQRDSSKLTATVPAGFNEGF